MLEQWHSILRRTKIVTYPFFARHCAYNLHILLSSQGSYFAPHLQGWAQVAVCSMRPSATLTKVDWTNYEYVDSCWANQNPCSECLGLGLEDSSSFWISLLKGGDLQLLAITDYYSKVLFPQWPLELCSLHVMGLEEVVPGDSTLLSWMVISWESSLPRAKNWYGDMCK